MTSQNGDTLHALGEGLSVTLLPAPLPKRILAYLIDLGVITAILYVCVILAIVAGGGFSVVAGALLGKKALGIGIIVVMIALFLGAALLMDGYFIYFESREGRTPGKRLFGLNVISESGGKPTVGQCVIRALVRYIDCFLVFPGLISIVASEKRRRLGDMAAGTLVVHSPYREKSGQFMYLTQETFDYLKAAFLPGDVPKDLADKYLAYSYPVFVQRSLGIDTGDVSYWDAQFKNYMASEQNIEINEEMKLRFYAELCFQRWHTEQ